MYTAGDFLYKLGDKVSRKNHSGFLFIPVI